MASVRDTPMYSWDYRLTREGAVSCVNRVMGAGVLEADAEFVNEVQMWVPIARLRSDQAYLKVRLEERGIKCFVEAAGRMHVSDLMAQAGAQLLSTYLDESGATLSVDSFTLVKRIYAAMESKR